jgi:hypothetical protein
MLKRAPLTVVPPSLPALHRPIAAPLNIPMVEPDRCELAVRAVLPSTATRNNNDASGKLPRVSKGSSISRLLNPSDNRTIICESSIEANYCLLLMADRTVKLIREQPPLIWWLDHAGMIRRHTFDFRVKLSSGEPIAVVVKHSKIAQTPDFQASFERIVAWTPISFAHRILLVTEKDIPWWATRNAALIRSCLMDKECSIDNEFRELVGSCVYPISIADLGQKLYDISLAFRPIVRLIADGTLVPVFQGLISEESLVRLGDVA